MRVQVHRQVETLGQRPRLALGQMAQREAQVVELRLRGAEQEIALVAGGIGATVQFRTVFPEDALDIVSGGQGFGAEVVCGLQQVTEFHGAIAGDARNRRLAARIGVGKGLHHLGPEAGFIVEHVMRDADALGHLAGILDVLPGTARATPADGDAMVVELERHPHDVVALLLQQSGRHGRIDAARHRHHDAGVAGRLVDVEGIAGHSGPI